MTDQQKFILSLLRDAILLIFILLSVWLQANGHQALQTELLTYTAQVANIRPCPTQTALLP